MSEDSPPRSQRGQFSLLTLLLVTAVIALSITVTLLYRELIPLRAAVTRLRDEVGELHIEDETKLHAIRVDAGSELEWKWRIWIPAGARYRLRGHGGPIPKEGFPSDGGTIDLSEPGEHVVHYRIRRDPKDGRWNGCLQTQRGSVGKDHQPWVEWRSRTATGGGVGTSTRAYETDQRVELIRHRVSQAKSSADIEDPSEGFMIWLEPN